MIKEARQEETKNRRVNFSLKAPLVKEVILMGDFNNWDAESHPMEKDENGVWKVSMKIPPGKYEYKLLVDGRWRLDSGNTQTVMNGFGTKNNVLTILEKH
jgi:1,4-alpha-glucan branching enzyme